MVEEVLGSGGVVFDEMEYSVKIVWAIQGIEFGCVVVCNRAI